MTKDDFITFCLNYGFLQAEDILNYHQGKATFEELCEVANTTFKNEKIRIEKLQKQQDVE